MYQNLDKRLQIFEDAELEHLPPLENYVVQKCKWQLSGKFQTSQFLKGG